MKNNIYRCFWLGMCIISLSFLASCSGGGGLEPAPSGGLVPPSNVTVVRDEDGLRVSWSPVPGALAYRVKRKDGNGGFAFVSDSDSQITETTWTDSNYPKENIVRYAVMALNQTEFSALSEPSDPICEQVQDISATKMKFTERIELHWAVHPENPDSYKIYRKSKSNNDAVFLTETTNNFYHDNTVTVNEIYYYRVTWVKDEVEYGNDVELVYGVRGSDSDLFEANDDQDHPALLIKGNISTAYTYVLSDHFNGYKIDTDWYQYHKTSTDTDTLIVKITLPPDSPYRGKLKLQFYKNGLPMGDGNTLDEGENRADIRLTENVTDISFKVEPFGLLTGTEGIGSYTIELL